MSQRWWNVFKTRLRDGGRVCLETQNSFEYPDTLNSQSFWNLQGGKSCHILKRTYAAC